MHTLLDGFLPRYDVHEVHETLVPASPAETWAALEAVTARELRAAAPLMALRGLPSLLSGGRSAVRGGRDQPLLQAFERRGFVRLAEEPGHEVVLGAVGRFWRLRPEVVALPGPEAFTDFAQPGYARAVFNLLVTPDGRSGARVRTETRVLGTDDHASRLFRRYWAVIGGGSGLIRRSWLAAIRRRASAGGAALVH